ncbi:crustapain isoform X1 [Diabrotica virgifera virgifera]|uniref:Crustapain-like n=1 Tax=Diabrotica virgifera virgifera TaxID=50390 RepID=A0A6P7G9W8_DIAVI|nr:crustapain isoform X1 [Diabrotica virgifera virgifera]
MKIILVVLVIVAAATASTDEEKWRQFKITHNRVYNNIEEHKHRFEIFKKNLIRIKEQNEKYEKGESTFNFGITQFADLTEEEFLSRFKLAGSSKLSKINSNVSSSKSRSKTSGGSDDLPEQYDWVRTGAVTPVRDVADCGDCTAESVVAAVEGAEFIKTGNLIQRSPKQLEDCIPFNPDECWICYEKVLNYTRDFGIMTEKDYPWKFESEDCQIDNITTTDPLIQIIDWIYVSEGDEVELQRTLYLEGPVVVSIDATINYQLYADGVLDDPTCGNTMDDMDTTLLLVGYGESKRQGQYWILKNYIGTFWGNNGYLWLRRNKNNQCGVATSAVIPVLDY